MREKKKKHTNYSLYYESNLNIERSKKINKGDIMIATETCKKDINSETRL